MSNICQRDISMSQKIHSSRGLSIQRFKSCFAGYLIKLQLDPTVIPKKTRDFGRIAKYSGL